MFASWTWWVALHGGTSQPRLVRFKGLIIWARGSSSCVPNWPVLADSARCKLVSASWASQGFQSSSGTGYTTMHLWIQPISCLGSLVQGLSRSSCSAFITKRSNSARSTLIAVIFYTYMQKSIAECCMRALDSICAKGPVFQAHLSDHCRVVATTVFQRPENALKSIAEQLISAWRLTELDSADILVFM